MPLDRTLLRGWPRGGVALAEVMGIEAASQLMRALGGTRFYVPVRAEPAHRLSIIVGMAAAQRLTEACGGQMIEIPTLYFARSRKAEIAADTGPSVEVALRFGVSERWVRMVRNVDRPDDRQLTLFND